jgi:Zn finger protein HypA/HybF involved in hydrogenase expression
MTVIYSCPDCDGDLTEEGFGLWCPACETTVPYAQLTGVTDADLD